MHEEPIVSILMSVFNEEKFIKKCLESIIGQTFKEWEMIVVDDFSQDSTFEILCQFAKRDQRIRVYRNEYKGIIPALEMAFLKSRGRFVTRMDGDDLMPSNKLESLYNHLKSIGEGHIVSGKVKYFSAGVLHDGFRKYERWINQQQFITNIYQECTLPSACWMAYRSDLVKVNAFIDSGYPEDYDLLFRFYQHGFKFVSIDKVLHWWRDHPNRASRIDPNYADQNFFELKVKYFLNIDQDSTKTLFLWGAGRKGKALAKIIKENKAEFRWITDNVKKIGKEIYGIQLESMQSLSSQDDKQVIIAISSLDFQKNEKKYMEKFQVTHNQFFNFC